MQLKFKREMLLLFKNQNKYPNLDKEPLFKLLILRSKRNYRFINQFYFKSHPEKPT